MLSIDMQTHGLSANHRADAGNPLRDYHRHNEVELNFLGRGGAVYNFGGRKIPLPPRSLAVFWAGISHRLEVWRPGGEIWAFSVPPGIFLGWQLPRKTFLHPLLAGEFIHEPDPALAALDEAAARRWHADLHEKDPAAAAARRDALLHEIHARLIRLALNAGTLRGPGARGDTAAGVVGKMLQYIAAHYRSPGLDVNRIARHAGITGSYANDHFRKTCGVSLMRHVNQQRVTHAQCLLATTGEKITDIAMDSGFGSVSQFYAVFRGVTGATPRGHTRTRGKN